MLKINLVDISGKIAGKVSLPEEIFAAKINPQLEALAVKVYLANQRTAGAKTKTRAEVNRTKAKWYRQKHTGKARHGSRAANLFVGGGIVFGPTGRENYKLNMSQKMRRAALFSALTGKLQDKKILVVEGLEKVKPKTSQMAKILRILDIKEGIKTLIILPKKVETVDRATRNIENISLEQANLLNTYLVLNHDQIVLMKEAIERLKEVFLTK